jgi:hypothetical protein
MKKEKFKNQETQGIEWALLSEEERKRLLNLARETQFLDRENAALHKLKGKELNIKKRTKS